MCQLSIQLHMHVQDTAGDVLSSQYILDVLSSLSQHAVTSPVTATMPVHKLPLVTLSRDQ